MGQDIAIRTKVKIKVSGFSEPDNCFLILDRGFCEFCENARNKSAEIVDSLAKALHLNLDFLLEPQYYEDPEGVDPNFEKWVDLKSFLAKLQLLINRFGTHPNYEQAVTYDREYWWNYFGDTFQRDLNLLANFLVEAQTQGVEEFTLEVV